MSMKFIRVIVINAAARLIHEEEVENTLEALQRIVGGNIERAMTLENGDEVFVNEEGLLSHPTNFFTIDGGHQPFAGDAFVIGAADDDGESTHAESSVDEIIVAVNFMTLKQVKAWRPDDEA